MAETFHCLAHSARSGAAHVRPHDDDAAASSTSGSFRLAVTLPRGHVTGQLALATAGAARMNACSRRSSAVGSLEFIAVGAVAPPVAAELADPVPRRARPWHASDVGRHVKRRPWKPGVPGQDVLPKSVWVGHCMHATESMGLV